MNHTEPPIHQQFLF